MISDSDQALLALVEVLEQLGIAYMIGGSVASSLFGVPRFTMDVDIMAQIMPDDVASLVTQLSEAFYIDADMVYAACATVDEQAAFNILYLPLMIKIDLFLRRHSAWEQARWERRIKHEMQTPDGAKTLWVTSPEDMVLQKLLWYRRTGERSDRQWSDIQGILKVQRQVDLAYLRHWAKDLALDDLLSHAFADAGVSEPA